MWSHFSRELIAIGEKTASITAGDTRKGVRQVKDLDKFVALAKPGDIIAAKRSDQSRHSLATVGARAMAAVHGSTSPWHHTGIYEGKGKITHTYADYKKDKFDDRDTRVRTQDLADIPKAHRDLLILRPAISQAAKRQVIKRMRSLRGTPYSHTDVFRSAVFPSAKDVREQKPAAIMCNGATAWALEDAVDFRPGIAPKHVLPHQIVDSPKLRQVAAYSKDG